MKRKARPDRKNIALEHCDYSDYCTLYSQALIESRCPITLPYIMLIRVISSRPVLSEKPAFSLKAILDLQILWRISGHRPTRLIALW